MEIYCQTVEIEGDTDVKNTMKCNFFNEIIYLILNDY